MKSKRNLVLLGMMGSGKSTIGYLLSKSLDLEFCDIDLIIEKEAGCKIAEIFNREGESSFRKIEEKICLKILKFNKKIISLGGGSFLNNKIREEIQNNHVSFWLNWNTSTIIRRIKKNKNRPILKGMSENEINKLIIKRKKIYEKAHLKINCENLSKNEIINKIIKLYEGK